MSDSDQLSSDHVLRLLERLAARQDEMATTISDIRLSVAMTNQLGVRMDYVEKGISSNGERIRSLEQEVVGLRKEIGGITGDLKTMSARLDMVCKAQESTQNELWSLIKAWGPWLGILGLFLKDILTK